MAKKAVKKCCDGVPVKLKPDATADQLAKLAWAIAHPARVEILRLLIGRDACMCGEIVSCLPLAQSTVSQHLKILKDSTGARRNLRNSFSRMNGRSPRMFHGYSETALTRQGTEKAMSGDQSTHCIRRRYRALRFCIGSR